MYHRLVTALTASLIVSACGTPKPPVMPDGVDFRVIEPRFAQRIDQTALGSLHYRGGVALQSRDLSFGSFSGLHISADGSQVDAVGWGSWLRGTLAYDNAGKLVDFTLDTKNPLTGLDGSAIADEMDQDAESLVFDGTSYLVGFETNNRIWAYSRPNGRASAVDLPDAVLKDVPGWGGFSSLTTIADNGIIALTEGGRDVHGNVKGFLFGGQQSGLIWLRASDWLPVDLSMLPDGDLLLLEIRFDKQKRSLQNRVSRIDRSQIKPGQIMQPKPLAMLEPPQFYGKIEAAHAMASADGQTRVYLMSDTRNGWPTRLLMFELR